MVDVPALKKKRGPTKCLRIWEIKNPQDRLAVRINRLGQPIGRNACTFTRFLGTVARKGNLAPIDYKSWHQMPKINKEHMWKIVEEKIAFHPPETSTIKGWTLQDINDKWRSWKATLKLDHYDEVSNVNDLVDKAVAVKGVDRSQFQNLLIRWRTPEDQASSEQNATNRSKSDQPHRAGTKSFARLGAEMAEELKREPTRWEIYVKTRVYENGTTTSDAASKVVENINKINSTGTTSQEGEPSIIDDVLARAQSKPERNGRERCVGSQPPSNGRRRTSGTSINFQVHQDLKNQYDQVQKENGKLKSRMDWMNDYLKAVSEKIGMPIPEFDGDTSDMEEEL